MISTESLKHFKLLLDTAQVFQGLNIHILPYSFDTDKIQVELVQGIQNWRLIGVVNIGGLIIYMIGVLLGLLLWTSQGQGIPNIVVAIWILTMFLTFLGCQMHLQIFYVDIFQWINSVRFINNYLSEFIIF